MSALGFSGLSDVRQESLFPDLELPEPEAEPVETATEAMFAPDPDDARWRVGDDVAHRDLGHGWVQGAGHGVVTVRFETRSSGPGQARTFAADTDELVSANPGRFPGLAGLRWRAAGPEARASRVSPTGR